MKAIIEFNLDDPEDLHRYELMNKAMDLAGALWDITHNTKKSLEYQFQEIENLDAYDALDKIYERIYEILEDHDVNIDKLYS